MDDYLLGQKLIGDDFDTAQLQQWYADEAEGYANLGSKDRSTYKYGYHSLNRFHGFSKIPTGTKFPRALGVGSAYGDEFEPYIDRIDRITIIEPSDQLVGTKLGNITLEYTKPALDGALEIENDQFDLITSFGTLHHIANVSTVVGELLRVLKPGGHMLIREPIHSMGDWNRPRSGLTAHERGIPVSHFERMIQTGGGKVLHQARCIHAMGIQLQKRVKFAVWNKPFVVGMDSLLCKMPHKEIYLRRSFAEKFAPNCVFLVITK